MHYWLLPVSRYSEKLIRETLNLESFSFSKDLLENCLFWTLHLIINWSWAASLNPVLKMPPKFIALFVFNQCFQLRSASATFYGLSSSSLWLSYIFLLKQSDCPSCVCPFKVMIHLTFIRFLSITDRNAYKYLVQLTSWWQQKLWRKVGWCAINDPLGQTHNYASSNHYFHLKFV